MTFIQRKVHSRNDSIDEYMKVKIDKTENGRMINIIFDLIDLKELYCQIH